MPDENEKQEGQSVSPSDLFRLKHRIGKGITWGKSNLYRRWWNRRQQDSDLLN